MATYQKFEQFVTDLSNGVHSACLTADTDVLKVALTNTAPTLATDATFSNITEITAENGYTAGGEDIANVATESGGTITLTGTDVTWNATGNIGPFRFLILYNDTPSAPADPLIAMWDYGSSLSLSNGESFTVDFGANIFTLG